MLWRYGKSGEYYRINKFQKFPQISRITQKKHTYLRKSAKSAGEKQQRALPGFVNKN